MFIDGKSSREDANVAGIAAVVVVAAAVRLLDDDDVKFFIAANFANCFCLLFCLLLALSTENTTAKARSMKTEATVMTSPKLAGNVEYNMLLKSCS